MRTQRLLLLIATASLLLVQLPAQAGWNPLAREKASDQSAENLKTAETIANFKNRDAGMQVFFDNEARRPHAVITGACAGYPAGVQSGRYGV